MDFLMLLVDTPLNYSTSSSEKVQETLRKNFSELEKVQRLQETALTMIIENNEKSSLVIVIRCYTMR